MGGGLIAEPGDSSVLLEQPLPVSYMCYDVQYVNQKDWRAKRAHSL